MEKYETNGAALAVDSAYRAPRSVGLLNCECALPSFAGHEEHGGHEYERLVY